MEKYNLPACLNAQCIWIMRGYDRCRSEYLAARRDIMTMGAQSFDESGVKTSSDGRSVEEVTAHLQALDNYPAFRQMFAVEHALDAVVENFPLTMRDRVKKALMLSCKDGRVCPFERLDVPGVSRSGFYRLRRHVLYNIAQELDLLPLSKSKRF